MQVKRWNLLGAVFTIILGTLLHFTYQWSGNQPIVGYFSPVSESTFEHLKLLITPMLLWGILEYVQYGRNIENFIPVRVLSIFLGMAAIVVFFYTYVGIVGNNYLIADILVFIVGVIVAYTFSYRKLDTSYLTGTVAKKSAIAGMILLLLSLAVFTYHPPGIGLFQMPDTAAETE